MSEKKKITPPLLLPPVFNVSWPGENSFTGDRVAGCVLIKNGFIALVGEEGEPYDSGEAGCGGELCGAGLLESDRRGGVAEECLSAVELKGVFGEGGVGNDGEEGVDGGDGEIGGAGEGGERYEGASADQEKA